MPKRRGPFFVAELGAYVEVVTDEEDDPEGVGGRRDDDDPSEDEEDAAYFQAMCGWIPGAGFCAMAGTEHCDFDCPYRDYLEEDVARKVAKRRPAAT